MTTYRSHIGSTSRVFRKVSLARGFSLLELMIVLVIMVGVLALAWPNLQKPMKRAELSQATHQLRVAIDESRYQAISSGTPVFIRMKMGESELAAGRFESFASSQAGSVARESDRSRVSNSIAPATSNAFTPASSEPKVWKLPENVVISEVYWHEDKVIDREEYDQGSTQIQPEAYAEDRSFQSQQVPAASRTDQGEIESSAEAIDLLGTGERVWWLPLSSLQQGRDVEIVLWDKNAQESMRVSLSATTGELEIRR